MWVSDLPPHIGHRVRPMPGETVCGDACAVWMNDHRIILAVADGLGHGPGAADAADAVLQCINRQREQSCEENFAECNRQLYGTRGAALALAIIDSKSKQLTVATVGNIRAVLLTKNSERFLGGARGIVGAGFNNLIPETADLATDDILMLYSDGFNELLPWRDILLPNMDATHIAANALSLWARDNDDAAMLIYRHP